MSHPPRIPQHRRPIRTSFQLLLVGLVSAGLMAGCRRQAAQDEVAHDVRGEPMRIKSPAPTNGVVAAPTNAIVLATPGTTGAIATASAATNPVSATLDGKEILPGGYKLVGFDHLAGYTFEVSDELMAPSTNAPAPVAKADDQIPETVRSLHDKLVAVRGFMLPLKVQAGHVTEMLLMRDQSMCCYGTVPKINEWISVKMQGEGVKPVMDQPVTLFGRLSVGEMRENGYLVGIYSLVGEKMVRPED